jgi:hypothetical protein
MIEQAEKTIPIAVWIEGFVRAPQAYFANGYICEMSARVRTTPFEPDFALDYLTNALSRELLEKCELFLQHGFTVINVPESWSTQYGRPSGWVETLINQALNQIVAAHDETHGTKTPGYDEDLAQRVLNVLNDRYPYPVSLMDLKQSLPYEKTSDGLLLTTLHGLQVEDLVTGKGIPPNTSSNRKLRATGTIQMTKEGRKHLSGTTDAKASILHQYNNFGQSGAMGPNSTGTVNYQQQWAATSALVDLSLVFAELQTIKAELMKTASTTADFEKLALVAKAELYAGNEDGPKVMEVLSNSGKWLFEFATKVGTDIIADLVAKAMGLAP